MADYVDNQDTADTPRSKVPFEDRLRWYEAFVLDKSEEIKRAKRDRRYYDGIQWTAEEIKDFRDRGQPLVTYNRIQPKVNYILGHEVRTRVDPEAFPRTPHHEDSKDAVTDALRYIDDEVAFDSVRSYCTEDLLIQGCTAAVVGIDEGKIFTKRVRWRNFFHDPKSTEPDFSDAKYLGVAMWWDKEDALAEPQYADAKDVLEDACYRNQDTDDFNADSKGVWSDPERKRVLIVELYWREGDQWWVCHTTFAGDLIEPKQIPYTDEDGKSFCPLIATSCYVVQEDDQDEGPSGPIGERYGIVRNMVSPQDEINHRRSRALHDLNVYGAIYEENAVENVRSFLIEMAKPGGMAKVRDGALQAGALQLRQPGQLAAGHLQLMQEAKAEIDALGPSIPVTAGAGDPSMSGRAILAKQSIGSMELERPFDNVRQWQRRIFKAWWWLIRHPQLGWTEEMWLRVRDSKTKEGYRFVAVNQLMTRAQRVQELLAKDVPFPVAMRSVGLPAGVDETILANAAQAAQAQVQQAVQMQGAQIPPQQLQPLIQEQAQKLVMADPVMQEQFKMHDIASLCMDIIIEETPDTTIAAHEEAAELMGLAQKVPQLGANPKFVEAIIRNSNLRGKSELIESLTPKPDPQAQQLQQAQMQMQMQQMQAAIQNLQAQAQLTMAKVGSEQAKQQRDVAQAQIAIPAEAQRDQADAMNKAADVGHKTVPQPPMMGGV